MSPPVGALVYKDALITMDGVEYANQCNKTRLVPDQPVQTLRTLVPDGVVQDADSVVWVLELAGLQINIAGGLAAALRSASGTDVDFVVQLKSGSGQPTATFTALAMMPEWGGEQGQFLPIDLTMPVQGGVVFGTSS